MEIIYQPRQTGRTQKLIQMCAEAEAKKELAYIVCASHKEAYRVGQIAEEMELFIPFPLTFTEFLRGQYAGSNIKHLLIDNADTLLRRISRVPIMAITLERKEI